MTEAPPPADPVILSTLLRGDIPRGRVRRPLSMGLRTLAVAAIRFSRDLGFEKAASLAYSSLLALMPFALLALSVIELLAVEEQEKFLQTLLDLVFPRQAQLRAQIGRLIQDSRGFFAGEEGATTTVRIVSLFLLLYFAASVLTTVDRVVANIWGGGSFKALLRRLSAYWAVITVGPFLLALSFAGTAIAEETLGARAGSFITAVLPLVISSLAIYLFYRHMPHAPVSRRAALVASVASGVLWEGSKLALGWWFSLPQPALFATLTFFPMVLLWMYVSWAIVIYGLEVAYVVHHGIWREGLRKGFRPRHGAARELLSVAAAVEIARCQDEGRAPDRADLSERLGAAESDVSAVVDDLILGGVVVIAQGGGFALKRGCDAIPAVDAIQAVRGRSGDAPLRGDSASALAAKVFLGQIEEHGCADGCRISLGDLKRAQPAAPAPSEPPKKGEI